MEPESAGERERDGEDGSPQDTLTDETMRRLGEHLDAEADRLIRKSCPAGWVVAQDPEGCLRALVAAILGLTLAAAIVAGGVFAFVGLEAAFGLTEDAYLASLGVAVLVALLVGFAIALLRAARHRRERPTVVTPPKARGSRLARALRWLRLVFRWE